MTKQEIKNHWTKEAAKILKGRKIVDVRYLHEEEMEGLMWDKNPICFTLDNGSICYVSSDDEGNNGGALFTMNTKGENEDIPTI